MLQQYLPFTVLKLTALPTVQPTRNVATVLTVYGIETTLKLASPDEARKLVATVLTVYGIETQQ